MRGTRGRKFDGNLLRYLCLRVVSRAATSDVIGLRHVVALGFPHMTCPMVTRVLSAQMGS